MDTPDGPELLPARDMPSVFEAVSTRASAVADFLRRLALEERALAETWVKLGSARARGASRGREAPRASDLLIVPRCFVRSGASPQRAANAPAGEKDPGPGATVAFDEVRRLLQGRAPRQVLFVGRPGLGKTTFLRLAFTWHARQTLRALEQGRLGPDGECFLVPLLLPLREVVGLRLDDLTSTLFLERAAEHTLNFAFEGKPAPDELKEWLDGKRERGELVLYLDGFDELVLVPSGSSPPGETQGLFAGLIQRVEAHEPLADDTNARQLVTVLQALKGVRCAMTTRPTRGEQAAVRAGLRVLELAQLRAEDVEAYVRRRFDAGESAEVIARLDLTPGPRQLSEVPLFLGILCETCERDGLEHLPRTRTALLHVALNQWIARAIEEGKAPLGVDDIPAVVEILAEMVWRRGTAEPVGFPEGTLIRSLRDLASPENARGILEALLKVGLLYRGPGPGEVSVVLRQVQEYLLGRKLAEHLSALDLAREEWKRRLETSPAGWTGAPWASPAGADGPAPLADPDLSDVWPFVAGALQGNGHGDKARWLIEASLKQAPPPKSVQQGAAHLSQEERAELLASLRAVVLRAVEARPLADEVREGVLERLRPLLASSSSALQAAEILLELGDENEVLAVAAPPAPAGTRGVGGQRSDSSARVACVVALARARKPSVVAALEALARAEPEYDVRQAAIVALGRNHGEGTARTLGDLIRDGGLPFDLRERALVALPQGHAELTWPPGRPDPLERTNRRALRWAARALARQGLVARGTRFRRLERALTRAGDLHDSLWQETLERLKARVPSDLKQLKKNEKPHNHLGLPEYRHEPTGLVFVLLPGGAFWMGSRADDPEAYEAEKKRHRVFVRPFLLARGALSRGQWEQGGGDREVLRRRIPWRNPRPDQPVVNVDWNEAWEFCARWGWELPSEAEWEYAARGGTETRYAFGDEAPSPKQAMYSGQKAEPGPVGVEDLDANAFGLHSMHGNVWEWVRDVYFAEYYGQAEARGPAPLCLRGSPLRVRRGGSWWDTAGNCRSAYRRRGRPRWWYDYDGFRPSRPLP